MALWDDVCHGRPDERTHEKRTDSTEGCDSLFVEEMTSPGSSFPTATLHIQSLTRLSRVFVFESKTKAFMS